LLLEKKWPMQTLIVLFRVHLVKKTSTQILISTSPMLGLDQIFSKFCLGGKSGQGSVDVRRETIRRQEGCNVLCISIHDISSNVYFAAKQNSHVFLQQRNVDVFDSE